MNLIVDNKQLLSNFQLKHKTIGFGEDSEGLPTEGIQGHFYIPSYQRGYRWEHEDVNRLLNDISNSNGSMYSLQPIVVMPWNKGESKDLPKWELIDGQQRLTTLWLIFNYMKTGGWKRTGAAYSLEYETRKDSAAYLADLSIDGSRTNIDFFHLYQANQAIGEWFDKADNDQAKERLIGKIHGYLCDSVRVIWYEAPANIDATALFTRLNVGRIALTNAELIKAALLSVMRKQTIDKTKEVAAQWDGIERDLQHSEIWAFVAGMTNVESDEKYPTRISLLLDTLADENKAPRAGKRPRYYTYDTLSADINNNSEVFWQEVVALHAKILGWFEQPNIYNKIGFLVACGDHFGAIVKLSRGKKKSEFEALLKQNIKNNLDVKVDDLYENLCYDDPRKGYPTLLKLLLLLNVETTTNHRFPFDKHANENWSLEHIHAQNAQDLTKAEQWKTWLETHRKALNVVEANDNYSEIKKLIAEVSTAIEEVNSPRFGERFKDISSRVEKILRPEGDVDKPDHTLANMALLTSAHNSSLNNSVFEVKRQMILALDRKDEYVPVCTRNVFLKYYAEADIRNPHYWGEADKKSYLAEIQTRLADYLI